MNPTTLRTLGYTLAFGSGAGYVTTPLYGFQANLANGVMIAIAALICFMYSEVWS